MVKCRNCGVEVSDSFDLCPNCGSNLKVSSQNNNETHSGVLICSGCGNEVPGGVNFCPDCGEKMEQIEDINKCNKCGSKLPENVLFTMKEKLELQYRANTMMKHLSYIMAGISIIVVVLSIYSTISLDAVTRQKDIAIRKINGANKRDIARHYLLPYLAIYGVTFAVVYPLLANLFLLSIDFNFGFTTNTIILCGAIQFIGTIILLMAVTWHKIMLIMHVNPAEVIRRE